MKAIVKRKTGILANSRLRRAEPLEREVARMKELKMPIQGGARPMYAEEDDDVVAEESDYRIGKMDIGRNQVSTIMAELQTQTADIPVNEGNEAGEAE